MPFSERRSVFACLGVHIRARDRLLRVAARVAGAQPDEGVGNC
jgi:hypothetical protein